VGALTTISASFSDRSENWRLTHFAFHSLDLCAFA